MSITLGKAVALTALGSIAVAATLTVCAQVNSAPSASATYVGCVASGSGVACELLISGEGTIVGHDAYGQAIAPAYSIDAAAGASAVRLVTFHTVNEDSLSNVTVGGAVVQLGE